MLDVCVRRHVRTNFEVDPLVVLNRRVVEGYVSRVFGVCDMECVTVEPEPMSESLIYLFRLREKGLL
jgi:hypothetical protein